MRAADFEFDTSVTAWSDYLQARLHPRSLASLRPHEHEYTDFELWGEGVALARAEGADESRGPMLLERVRRFLEECDAPQGFVLAADVNGGFGGLARELLAQIRDDYSTAPCVALAVGTHAGALPTSTAPSSPGKSGGDAPREAAHRYATLHDARSHVVRCRAPVHDHTHLWLRRAALGRRHPRRRRRRRRRRRADVGGGRRRSGRRRRPALRVAPPYVTPRAELSYHAAAPLAAFLDGITLPARARRAPASLGELSAPCASARACTSPPACSRCRRRRRHTRRAAASTAAVRGSRRAAHCSPAGVGARVRAARAWLGAPPAAARPADAARPAAAAAAGGGGGGGGAPAWLGRSCRCGATRRAARCGRGRSRRSCRSPSPSSSRRRRRRRRAARAARRPAARHAARRRRRGDAGAGGRGAQCTLGLVPLLRRRRDAYLGYAARPSARRSASPAASRPRSSATRRGGAGDDRGVRGGVRG